MNHGLLIDDDVELVRMFSEYLEQEGFRVACVHNGDDGARAAMSGDYAIAILDVMMPGTDGIEALHRICAGSRRIGQVAGIVAGTLASLLFAALLAGNARGGDELSDLGRDFDRMSAQLRGLMDGQRRLLHDVSHELRSPLARLQAAVGLAHQQPDKIASSLDRIERESMRMDKLVGGLLTLSRLEASPAVVRREQIDLAELLDEIVADARFEAGAGQPGDPRVRVDASGPVVVQGDPDLLWSALENVVRNAVRHGGSAAQVRALVRSDGRYAHIDVLDHGPGIAPADLASVFVPFFRSNPGANVDGHGLGLAIAQRVVLAHGGQIRAANRDGGGLQVTISLPLGA